MLFMISTMHPPATDPGVLVHRKPSRFRSFNLPFGKADVFCPEAESHRCTVLLLNIDPVGWYVRSPVCPGPAVGLSNM